MTSVTTPVSSKTAEPSLARRLQFWRGVQLSPINRRRWDNFKANRRGYWSLWIFGVLFFLSLFAEFIANDRPILMSYKGEILAPVFVDYPEEKFGGFSPSRIIAIRDPERNRRQRLGYLAADRLFLRHDQQGLSDARAGDGSCTETKDGIEVASGIGFPAPPQWASSVKLCDADPEQLARYHAIGNMNWLGLDDQGRDVMRGSSTASACRSSSACC